MSVFLAVAHFLFNSKKRERKTFFAENNQSFLDFQSEQLQELENKTSCLISLSCLLPIRFNLMSVIPIILLKCFLIFSFLEHLIILKNK